MTTYKTRKAAARDAAIMAQQEAAEQVQSWEEVAAPAVSVSCGSSGKTALFEQTRRITP